MRCRIISDTQKSNYESLFKREPMPNIWSGYCFGCSSKNSHGLKLKFWPIQNGCVSYYTIPDYLCGFDKVAHGGIIATLLDEIAAWSIGRIVFQFGVTMDAYIKYIKPVPTNKRIILEGKVLEHNGNYAITEAYLKDTENEVLAECKSNWMLPTYEQFAKIAKVDTEIIKEMIITSIEPMKNYLKDF